ncbi:MAG: hypothetical protein ACW96N_05090 [Candidatus Thorarchaeota archaeon]|jgi:hypothetical protein
MANPIIVAGFHAAIEIEYPMVDILAVTPYVLPLLFIGAAVLLYQRHLPQDSGRRNLLVAAGGGSFLAGIITLLYAAFGGTPWVEGQDFGTYEEFMGVIQIMTDLIFGNEIYGIFIGALYIVIMAVIFAGIASKVISPPDPDFVALRDVLKEAQDKMKSMKDNVQKMEGENKELNEFLSEKESSLSALQAQLDAIKAEVSEREAAMSAMEATLSAAGASPDQEQELLQTISEKDQTISNLQAEIEVLKVKAESGVAAPGAVDIDSMAKLQDYVRRAETASEVSDSVISDLAELISQVEGSPLDVSAQIAITTLIKTMGRAMGRVSAPPSGLVKAEPKIELIGAVMIAHELVDGIKKMARGS